MTKLHRILVLFLAAILASFSVSAPTAGATFRPPSNPNAMKVFVDTDIGVDDAIAIAYLLKDRSANVIGFTTVGGNTDAENSAHNLMTLLDVMHIQKPITIGSSNPLEFAPSRTGWLVHGKSGLWSSQVPHDLSTTPRDAPAAIAAAARANPGMTLLALGPLTNVAQAVQRFPADMAGLRVIALGGTRSPGGSRVTSEFNIYFDPHALDVVLHGGMNVTLVTMDAFKQVEVDTEDFAEELTDDGGQLGRFLAPAFTAYAMASTQGAGGKIAIPDAAAVLYMLKPALGTAQSALIYTVTDNDKTRGQTIIATKFSEKILLIADDAEMSVLAERFFSDPTFNLAVELGMIIAREPDNAQVVLEVRGPLMARALESGLTR